MTQQEIVNKLIRLKVTLASDKVQLDNAQSKDEEGEIEMQIRHTKREIKKLEDNIYF